MMAEAYRSPVLWAATHVPVVPNSQSSRSPKPVRTRRDVVRNQTAAENEPVIHAPAARTMPIVNPVRRPVRKKRTTVSKKARAASRGTSWPAAASRYQARPA